MNEQTSKKSDYPSADQLKQLRRGERDAFGEVVQKYQHRVYAMIMRTVGDEAIARDIAQETFLRAYQYISSYRAEASLATWLIRIAVNCTNSYFKSSVAQINKASDSWDVIAQEQINDVQENFSTLEKIIIRRAVSELEPIYRSVVWLRSFEGLPYKEIAKVLEIPTGTVSSRMNTALHLLKEKLKGEWS